MHISKGFSKRISKVNTIFCLQESELYINEIKIALLDPRSWDQGLFIYVKKDGLVTIVKVSHEIREKENIEDNLN